MADVDSDALSFNARKRLTRRGIAAVAFIAIALSGSGCSMIDQFNPFGGEKYKMEVTPDVPASKTYDQGLEKLANGSPAEAAKKFTDLGKQYPSSDWARKGLLMTTYANYQAGDYTSRRNLGRALSQGLPELAGSGLHPVLAGEFVLHANTGYLARPGKDGESARDVPGGRAEISEVGIRRRREIQDPRSPRINWPARKCRSGASTSIAATTPPRSTAFRNVLQYYQTTRHAAEALYRLVEAYLGLGITEEAQTAAAVLGHNFPDSEWYHDAYDLLKGKGLSPHDFGGSWISTIWHTVVPS